MEMRLVGTKDNPKTKIKISTSEWKNSWVRDAFQSYRPKKESNRFIYFEIDGDFINHK